MTHSCPDCIRGWRHCHGTLLLHRDGSSACLDEPSCDGDVAIHDLVVACTEVGSGCGCVAVDIGASGT